MNVLKLVVVSLITAALLAACGPQVAAPPPATQDPAPVQDATSNDAVAGADDELEFYELIFLRENDMSDLEPFLYRSFYANYVRDRFNIGWQEIHFAGDFQERAMLELAGRSFPDIINPRSALVLNAYAEAGALIELGELFQQHAPNVLSRHAERLPFWRSMSGMEDGGIYAMTFWQPDETGARAQPLLEWLIRSDILEQQGFPEIRDENDLFEVLSRGLEENPTTNGQPTVAFNHPLNSWGTNGLSTATFTWSMGRLCHRTLNRTMVFDFGPNQFIDLTMDHSYRNGLEFFNRMWREGLYDRDAITDDWDDFEIKMRQGRILAAHFYVWPWHYDFNPALEVAGAPFRYVPFTFQLSSHREQNEPKIYTRNAGEVWTSTAITVNARYPERIAQLMDWQATDEGMILAGWGREGVEFTIENGRRVPTAEYFDRLINDPGYSGELHAPSDFGFFLGVDDNGQSFRISHDTYTINRTLDPIVRHVWEQYGWSNSYEMYYHNVNFVFDDTHRVGLKTSIPTLTPELHRNWEIIYTTTHDATMNLITAESPEVFDQVFQTMLDRRAELGMGEILDLWNDEYFELRRIHGFD